MHASVHRILAKFISCLPSLLPLDSCIIEPVSETCMDVPCMLQGC